MKKNDSKLVLEKIDKFGKDYFIFTNPVFSDCLNQLNICIFFDVQYFRGLYESN